jgi:hypothetical protein
MIKHLSAGYPACVTITLVDGLVLARSVFNHSVNYRSAVVFGQGQAVMQPEAKRAALRCFMERLMPGRWADARQPNEQELKATGVVAIDLVSASAKVRSGPPKDDEDDLSLPVWAGVLPMRSTFGLPVPAPEAAPDQPLPAYLEAFLANRDGEANDSGEDETLRPVAHGRRADAD